MSFNTLVPGVPGSPGVNTFAIDNFTGPSSVPPDFRAADPLIFLGSSLLLDTANSTAQTVSLGNLGPGSYTPTSLQFFSFTSFTAAVFTATLNSSSFLLSDGSKFQPNGVQIAVTLKPLSNGVLSPGSDFAPISISDSPIVPEPHTGLLFLVGLGLVTKLCQRNRLPK
ncbi:MAG: hypothetical protein M3Y72_07525 [Acidobacteriota bacterium]|nr:hypothetical protein [Acidobacteriota bacterium]